MIPFLQVWIPSWILLWFSRDTLMLSLCMSFNQSLHPDSGLSVAPWVRLRFLENLALNPYQSDHPYHLPQRFVSILTFLDHNHHGQIGRLLHSGMYPSRWSADIIEFCTSRDWWTPLFFLRSFLSVFSRQFSIFLLLSLIHIWRCRRRG